MIAMYDKRWFGPCISSNIYPNLIILVSSNWQFSNLNIHTSHALKIGLIIRRDLYLCKGWVWENAYSSLKSV